MNKFFNKQVSIKWLQVIAFAGFLTIFLFAFVPYTYSAVLTHGPVVGGVTANEAKVFLRTDQSASVKIEYSTDPNLTNSLITNTFQTSYIKDFTIIIPLRGLNPQTSYYLNIYVNGVPQFNKNYPSFKTFPETNNPLPFKIVIFTDFKGQNVIDIFPTFTNASKEGADFAFIGGDFDHRDPETKAKKRKMFKDLYNPRSLSLIDFVSSILWRMPIVHHWDDHDAGANNIDKTYPYWKRSYKVFKEFVPTYDLPSAPYGIWQYFRYAHVDFFVLDCRSQRDPDTDLDDVNKSMLDGNNLGVNGQLEWLKQGLLNSTARWKIIFSSVPINPEAKPYDSWGAFQTEWGNLKKFIQDNQISGIVFISGDLHMGGIDNGIASGFPEMLVPASNLPDRCRSGPPGSWSEGIYYNPDGHCNGYGVVTVLTNPDRLLLEVKDQDGNTRLSYMIY